MKPTNANTHLTSEERSIIETGIRNGSTKTAIAKTIGKDNSTVGKEIKQHRYLKHKSPLALECANYKKCKHGRECTVECPDYEKFTCTRRDRSPGACNGCKRGDTSADSWYNTRGGDSRSVFGPIARL